MKKKQDNLLCQESDDSQTDRWGGLSARYAEVQVFAALLRSGCCSLERFSDFIELFPFVPTHSMNRDSQPFVSFRQKVVQNL